MSLLTGSGINFNVVLRSQRIVTADAEDRDRGNFAIFREAQQVGPVQNGTRAFPQPAAGSVKVSQCGTEDLIRVL